MMEITVAEAKEMLQAIDQLCLFRAFHLVGGEPAIPELVKLCDILKKIITSAEMHEVVRA